MSKKRQAIFLMVITTILIGAAQILYKKGAPALRLDAMALLTNWYVISGLFIYVIGAVLMTTSMKDSDLSTQYPILSLAYIWVNILAFYFLHEPIHPYKWIGTAFILVGVAFIGYGADKERKE